MEENIMEMNEEKKEEKITAVQALVTVILGIMLLGAAISIADLCANSLAGSMIFSDIIFAVIYMGITYFGVKFISEKFLKIDMKEYGIKFSKVQLKWVIIAFALPLAVCIILCITGGSMISNNLSTEESLRVIVKAVFRAGIASGFTEELIFRGLIMKTIEKKWGAVIAVTIPSVAFAAIHYNGSLKLTDFYMLLVSGTSIALMFSLIAYKSGSILNSSIVHGVWNMIMIGNILKIGTAHSDTSIFSFDLAQSSKVLTGGNFGAEVSIFAIAGYILVILFVLYKAKKEI